MPISVFNQEKVWNKCGMRIGVFYFAILFCIVTLAGCSVIQDELSPPPKPAATAPRDIASLSDLRRDVGSFQTTPAATRQCECNKALLKELEDLVSDRQNTVLAISDVIDNVKEKGVSWKSTCRGNAICPDSAYTIIYKRIPIDRLERDRLPFRTDFIRGVQGRSQKAKVCSALDNLAKVLINDVSQAKNSNEFFLLFRVQELGKQSIPGVEAITATMPIPAWKQLEAGLPEKTPSAEPAVPADEQFDTAKPAQMQSGQNVQRPQVQSSSTQQYTVVYQLAALGTKDAAERYLRMLKRDGFTAVIEPVEVESRTLYRILVTVSGTNEEIDSKMKKTGVLDPIVRSRTQLNPA